MAAAPELTAAAVTRVARAFPQSCRAGLGARSRAHGDSGARMLLRAAAALTLVGMPEAAFDIDTPADAARLR